MVGGPPKRRFFSRVQEAGRYGMVAGVMGGLLLDAVTWLMTGEGILIRIYLGFLVLGVSASMWMLAHLFDPYRGG